MFSQLVERALRIAIEAHDGQVRKGIDAGPYVVHPIHVAIMLARWGMDDDVIVAGILHDVVEDCDAWTVERVDTDFGAHVASIVAELTEDKDQSWEARKRHGVEKVATMSPQAASVKAADKLHNLRCLLADLNAAGDHADVWARFRGGRDGTLRVAREFVDGLRRRVDPRIGRALGSVLEEIEAVDANAVVSGS